MPTDHPICATCRWWHEVGSPHRPNIGLERVGNCHHFPPTQPTRLLVEASDWCGEHAPVEGAKGATMPADLVWTRVPPSEPGWWWVRGPNGRAVVEVKPTDPAYELCLVSGPVAVPVDITRGVEWSGPVPLPKEAPHA